VLEPHGGLRTKGKPRRRWHQRPGWPSVGGQHVAAFGFETVDRDRGRFYAVDAWLLGVGRAGPQQVGDRMWHEHGVAAEEIGQLALDQPARLLNVVADQVGLPEPWHLGAGALGRFEVPAAAEGVDHGRFAQSEYMSGSPGWRRPWRPALRRARCAPAVRGPEVVRSDSIIDSRARSVASWSGLPPNNLIRRWLAQYSMRTGEAASSPGRSRSAVTDPVAVSNASSFSAGVPCSLQVAV
jgi:hypothetical protein